MMLFSRLCLCTHSTMYRTDMKEDPLVGEFTVSIGVWKPIDHGPQSADGGPA